MVNLSPGDQAIVMIEVGFVQLVFPLQSASFITPYSSIQGLPLHV
jgi:hypothetical protein